MVYVPLTLSHRVEVDNKSCDRVEVFSVPALARTLLAWVQWILWNLSMLLEPLVFVSLLLSHMLKIDNQWCDELDVFLVPVTVLAGMTLAWV